MQASAYVNTSAEYYVYMCQCVYVCILWLQRSLAIECPNAAVALVALFASWFLFSLFFFSLLLLLVFIFAYIAVVYANLPKYLPTFFMFDFLSALGLHVCW